jgi:hypothetical protein
MAAAMDEALQQWIAKGNVKSREKEAERRTVDTAAIITMTTEVTKGVDGMTTRRDMHAQQRGAGMNVREETADTTAEGEKSAAGMEIQGAVHRKENGEITVVATTTAADTVIAREAAGVGMEITKGIQKPQKEDGKIAEGAEDTMKTAVAGMEDAPTIVVTIQKREEDGTEILKVMQKQLKEDGKIAGEEEAPIMIQETKEETADTAVGLVTLKVTLKPLDADGKIDRSFIAKKGAHAPFFLSSNPAVLL